MTDAEARLRTAFATMISATQGHAFRIREARRPGYMDSVVTVKGYDLDLDTVAHVEHDSTGTFLVEARAQLGDLLAELDRYRSMGRPVGTLEVQGGGPVPAPDIELLRWMLVYVNGEKVRIIVDVRETL